MLQDDIDKVILELNNAVKAMQIALKSINNVANMTKKPKLSVVKNEPEKPKS